MHPQDELEMAQQALAEMVTWTRGMAICPLHEHVTAYVFTPEGPTPWRGPICEQIPDMECEYRMAREALLDIAYNALGTRDMSGWLVGDVSEPEPADQCNGSPFAPTEGWWTISGEELLDALREVGEGADPDVVYSRLYSETETDED